MNAQQLAETIKADINDAISEGEIPASVVSFEDLHSYVDANMLGETSEVFGCFGEGEQEIQASCDIINEAQEIVDNWLKSGRK